MRTKECSKCSEEVKVMLCARNELRQTNECISSLLSGTTTVMLNATHNVVLVTTRAVHKAEI